MQDILLAHILVRKTRKNHLYVTFARTAPILARTAPILARTAPILARTAPILARTAPIFLETHEKDHKQHLFMQDIRKQHIVVLIMHEQVDKM